MHASNIDKNGKKHSGKHVKNGKCVFPFKFKRKEHNSCVDTGHGDWCPTSLTNTGTTKTWGYCVDKGLTNNAKKLNNFRKKTNNRSAAETLLMLRGNNNKSKKKKRHNSKKSKKNNNRSKNRRNSNMRK